MFYLFIGFILVVGLLAWLEISYKVKVNNRISSFEDFQRYSKPNNLKWWQR